MPDRLVERRCFGSSLCLLSALGLTFCRAVDRGAVDARLFWSAGGCFVGRPLRGKALTQHTEADLKTRQKRVAIHERRGGGARLQHDFEVSETLLRITTGRPSTEHCSPACSREHCTYCWPRTPSPRPLHARRLRSMSARALCNRNSCTASLDELRQGAFPHL